MMPCFLLFFFLTGIYFLCVCVFEREREERNRSGQAEVEREILMMFKVLILLGHYMPLLQDISVT